MLNDPKEEKFKNLCNDVVKLQESMDILHDLIKTQGDSVSSIEDYINESKNNIKDSSDELTDSYKYNYNMTYIFCGIFSIILYIII